MKIKYLSLVILIVMLGVYIPSKNNLELNHEFCQASEADNNHPESMNYIDWQLGKYQPDWLNHSPESRQMIDSALQQGLIRGYKKGELFYLNLSRNMSRLEMAVLLSRVLLLDKNNEDNADSSWYIPYIKSLHKAGIALETMNWSSSDWKRPVSRGEAARWAGQALIRAGKYISNPVNKQKSDNEIDGAVACGIINPSSAKQYAFDRRAEFVEGVLLAMRLQKILQLPPRQPQKPDWSGYLPQNTGREITISAVGDCTMGYDTVFPAAGSFDDVFQKNGNDYSCFFAGVRQILENDDLSIANMEGTLTDINNRAYKGEKGPFYYFRGQPGYNKILQEGSIEAVNMANNHTYDFGVQGYNDTLRNLQKVGVTSFGNGKAGYMRIKGIDIGLLGYNVMSLMDEKNSIAWMKKQVGQDIKNLKNEVDLVIVSFHWGIEGENQPCSKQVELGHYAVDSGADLVLGHHPHVIQKVEKYQNKYIVYSLANFCFGGSSNPRDKDSFIFQQSFIFDEKNSLVDSSRVQIIPCSISSRQDRNDYRPTVVTGENARRINLRVGL